MPVLIKREALFPSVTKPGLYFYDNQVDRFIDEDGNEVSINWDELSGIDYDEPNRFKFALGSWTEFTRNNRAIKLYPSNQMDFIRLGLGEEPVEPKPASPPDGFLENTEENALAYEPKPPKESWKLFSGYRNAHINSLYGFSDSFDPMFAPKLPGDEYTRGESGTAPTDEEGAGTAPYARDYNLADGRKAANYAVTVGDRTEIIVGPDALELSGFYTGATTDDKRGGWFKGGFNWTQDPHPNHAFGGTQRTHKVDAADFPFHNEPLLTSAHPEFKLYNPIRASDGDGGTVNFFDDVKGSNLTAGEINNIGRGYWRVEFNGIKRKESQAVTAKVSKFFKKIGSFFGDIVKSGEFKLYNNAYFEYEWKPNLDNIPHLNRAGAYHIPSYEWVWTGTDWIPAETLIEKPQPRQPQNQYIGVPIISDNKPNMDNVYSFEVQNDPTILPLFHDRRLPNFNKTAAPLKIWYAVNFFQQDINELFATNIYKYHIFEWGDEEIRLSPEEIEFSEFFSLYDTDEEGFAREQAKRLVQVVEQAKTFFDGNGKLNFTEHVYLTSGVKTIRAIVFRLSGDEKTLYETTLVTTNINVGETDETLESFNIYASNNFNILPIKTSKKELIVGSIEEKSDYVESLKKIEEDDFYGQQDYLEKTYIEEFLPKIQNSEYGNYTGKLDLSTTRIFKKPYDISYFLNSKVTDILIDDTDCLVEFNPYEIDNNRIENTGKSDDVGFVIGDYKVIKRKDEEMKKEDVMLLPEIQKQKDKQAI